MSGQMSLILDISSHNHRRIQGGALLHGFNRRIEGRARCPETILDCAFATWVLKHLFADVHTAKVCFDHFGRFYDSTVCTSLYFCIFPICWCLDRPILHFGGLTLSISIRFVPASNSDVVKRFSAALFRYLKITLVVVVVGFTGVTTRKLFRLTCDLR